MIDDIIENDNNDNWIEWLMEYEMLMNMTDNRLNELNHFKLMNSIIDFKNRFLHSTDTRHHYLSKLVHCRINILSIIRLDFCL